MPRQKTKQRIILEEVAQHFTWGQLYSELEVNALLKPIFDDISSRRRLLIDEGIMMREQGKYWLVRPHAGA
jgi:hypothetical protein